MNLSDKTVLVTGGAGAIGRHIVAAAQSRGARIAVIDVPGAALDALKREGSAVHTLAADLTDPDAAHQAVDQAWRSLNGIVVLVNCVGVIFSAPLISISQTERKHSVADWRRVMDANLNAVFFATREVVDRMVMARTRGVIVNFSSISASGNPGQSAYAASKAGVEALTTVWAKELGPMGIRVAAVAPGFIDTESTRHALNEAQLEQLRQRIPLRRLGAAADIAAAVMAVIENDYVSGKTFSVDGGLTI